MLKVVFNLLASQILIWWSALVRLRRVNCQAWPSLSNNSQIKDKGYQFLIVKLLRLWSSTYNCRLLSCFLLNKMEALAGDLQSLMKPLARFLFIWVFNDSSSTEPRLTMRSWRGCLESTYSITWSLIFVSLWSSETNFGEKIFAKSVYLLRTLIKALPTFR